MKTFKPTISKTIIAIMLCIATTPLISKGQGQPVMDIALINQSFGQMGTTIDNLIKQYEKAKQQYETLKNQYNMTAAQIAKLKKVSVAVMNFTSTESVVNSFKELSSTFKAIGKTFYAAKLVPEEIKEEYKSMVAKLAKKQDGIADKFALANQVDGAELSDKDRIDLVISAKEDADKLKAELDGVQAKMDHLLDYIDERMSWHKATEAVKNFRPWGNPW